MLPSALAPAFAFGPAGLLQAGQKMMRRRSGSPGYLPAFAAHSLAAARTAAAAADAVVVVAPQPNAARRRESCAELCRPRGVCVTSAREEMREAEEAEEFLRQRRRASEAPLVPLAELEALSRHGRVRIAPPAFPYGSAGGCRPCGGHFVTHLMAHLVSHPLTYLSDTLQTP